jgi:hypothetical protein
MSRHSWDEISMSDATPLARPVEWVDWLALYSG